MNVYLKPSSKTGRFTAFSREDIERGKGPAFDCVFVKKAARSRKSTGAGVGAGPSSAKKEKGKAVPFDDKPKSTSGGRGKRKRVEVSLSPPSTDDEKDDRNANGRDEAEDEAPTDEERYKTEMGDFIVPDSESDDIDEGDSDGDQWQTSLRGRGRAGKENKSTKVQVPPLKRARKTGTQSLGRHIGASNSSRTPPDDDIIELSD